MANGLGQRLFTAGARIRFEHCLCVVSESSSVSCCLESAVWADHLGIVWKYVLVVSPDIIFFGICPPPKKGGVL